MFKTLKKLIIGRPLANTEVTHQRLSKKIALAVFSSDALSSVAYATEEILLVLVTAGVAALHFSLPIAIAISILLFILIGSYSETIHAYPNGGGAYIVAKENLGKFPGLIAGASLMTDYVLTVAVSAASGVAAITSAIPELYPYRVWLCLVCIFFVTIMNLRGVKESGTVFAFPTYFFVASFLLLIGVGFFRYFFGIPPHPAVHTFTAPPSSLQAVTAILLLRAFSSGCAALTGVEAISNGVPAFKAPESRNAIITLVSMGVILLVLFLGITELARFYHIVPHEMETVVSQLAHHIFGDGLFYYMVQASTALILFLAANTSFSDFPRLSSLIARDGFLPRQLASLGDRLAFSNGIILLGICAGGLVILFNAQVHALIPLYAVGVFISFTLSQAGMVVHWFKLRTKAWMPRALLNGVGASTTGVATIVIAVSKFTHGAWMVIGVIPVLILMFLLIRKHYDSIVCQLSPRGFSIEAPKHHCVLIPVSTFQRGTMQAINYAESISKDVRAIYVELDPQRTLKLQDIWREWKVNVPLIALPSPYRSVLEPLVHYIDELQAQDPNLLITVVVPEFVPAKWWQQILHNQTAFLLYGALHFKRGVVVTSVRHFLEY